MTRVLLAVVFGCAHPALVAASPPAESVRPACSVTLVASTPSTQQVSVGKHVVALEPIDGPPQELRVFPADSNSVLLAYTGRTDNGPYGSSTLWKVACKTALIEAFVQIAEADFGHAVLARDRRSVFFSGRDGIFALDLASRRTKRLTMAASDDCAKNDYQARDVVRGWTEADVLAFERGCGYEHGWHTVSMVLRAPGKQGESVAPLETKQAPTMVALGAGGWRWSAADDCADVASFGRIVVASGKGDRTIMIAMLTPQPVRHIIADQRRAGAALVMTRSCGSAQHVDPAWIYLTEDGGNSFRPIGVPPGIAVGDSGGPASEQDPLLAIAAPGGSLDLLVLCGQSSALIGSMVGRWESRDRGKTWSVLQPLAEAVFDSSSASSCTR